MKQITIDYKLYQQELTDASLFGAKMSKQLIKELEQYLITLDSSPTQQEYYETKRNIYKTLEKLISYGNNQ